MLILPAAAEPLVTAFAPAFTAPTYRRFVLLLVGAIVTSGRRTVSHVLWTVRTLVGGDASSYHRVFCKAQWSLWPLGKALACAVVALVPPGESVLVAGDDTVAGHSGKKVWGKGCYRDAVRSGRRWTVRKWGHRWVTLAVLIKFPFASRRWALPVLCALYRPQQASQKERRRHKVPSQLAQQLLAALLHWFPQRRFIFLGDGHFSGHELADFARRHRQRLTLIGRLRAKASLYAKPPKRRPGAPGRTRQTGPKLRCPREQVVHVKHHQLLVRWYGNTRRRVRVVSGKGIWCRRPLRAPVRWVYVHDPISRRDDYFYSTDQRMSPRRIIELFATRWSIEVTFQEVRAHLGWETTRQRTRRSVLRGAACLMGCFSVVSLIFARHMRGKTVRPQQMPWYHKREATFADALFTVRRLLWNQTILNQSTTHGLVAKCPPALKSLLLQHLAEAA